VTRPLSARHAIAILATLAVALWGVFVYQVSQGPAHHAIVALGHALMLTAMLVAYPFLTGWRITSGHVEHGVLCRDCGAPRWDGQMSFGFCLRCGSTRIAKPAL
jgi:hypothetical protein